MDSCKHTNGLVLKQDGQPYVFCPDCRGWQWLAAIHFEPDREEWFKKFWEAYISPEKRPIATSDAEDCDAVQE